VRKSRLGYQGEWGPDNFDQKQRWKLEATDQALPLNTWIENNYDALHPRPVGTCVSAFVELKTTAQLKAEDTYWGWGAYSVEADARYGTSVADQGDVKIVCKYNP
jgi:hypothetical protein